MGPSPRSLAAEANDCFMVRLPCGPTEYKVAARFFARYGGLPSGRLLTQLQHPSQAAVAETPLRRAAQAVTSSTHPAREGQHHSVT
jgi:hypothetical protein